MSSLRRDRVDPRAMLNPTRSQGPPWGDAQGGVGAFRAPGRGGAAGAAAARPPFWLHWALN
eukprot:1196324-Prorocentrum_minimum.AAC.1